jgi:hypothetical protein
MAYDDAKQFSRSRGGLKITLNEESGHESFVVETAAGQKFLLQDGPGQIELIDGNGNSLHLRPDGITVNSAAKVTINASLVEINSGVVNGNAAMTKFSGIVQCNSVISNSVVSGSYSPGAGNIW